MIDQIFEGLFSGLARCLIAGLGYALFWLGQYLVTDFKGDGSSRGMPKWTAVITAIIISSILGLLASTPDAVHEDDNPLRPGTGEVVDVIEVSAPYKSFASSFTFCCACMSLGIARAVPVGHRSPRSEA